MRREPAEMPGSPLAGQSRAAEPSGGTGAGTNGDARGPEEPRDCPAASYEIQFRRSAASSMMLARALGVAFVFVQTWMYQPPEGITPPFELFYLAIAVAVAATTITVLGRLAAAGSNLWALRVGSWVEIAGDTAVVMAILFAFAFDVESQLWALMMLPAMEAAWRHRIHGALVTWIALTVGYTAREAFAASRYDYAEFIGHSVTYRSGLTLVITVIAALLARSLHRAGTAHVAASQVVQHQARTDSLTGLANRDHFLACVGAVLRSGTPCAVILLDLDRFGFVNDARGHEVGDEVLAGIARNLTGTVLAGEVVARTGGDEYSVLLVGDDRATSVVDIARDLQRRAAEPVHAGGRAFRLTASAATVVCGGRHATANDVERDVTLAMYEAKRQGPGGLAAFHHSLADAMQRRTDLVYDLPAALSTGEVRLVYQPIVHADGITVAGMEALVRWQHHTHGAVPPLEIVEVAAAAGVGADLLHRVLDEACAQAAACRGVVSDLFVSVNVASTQIGDVHHSLAHLADVLAIHDLDSDAVVLEITETEVVDSSMPIDALLIAARRRGVRIAIDDFGRDHSSLARLRQLDADIVKLDRELVEDLTTIGRDPEALQAVVRLVRTYGYRVLAEGIETDAQHRAVVDAGCELLQGFLFAQPMEADRLAPWLSQRAAPSTPERAQVDGAVTGRH